MGQSAAKRRHIRFSRRELPRRKHTNFLIGEFKTSLPLQSVFWFRKYVTIQGDGFGGLVVRMLASVSRVRGFKPGRSHGIFLFTKSSACLPPEGKLNNLSHVPNLRHVKEPSNCNKLRIASKIPSIKVPSFASRGLSRRLVWWRLWRWMRELRQW
jgi:hypothetical protein